LAADLTSSASGAELALNYADGKLYYKSSTGVVTLLAGATAGPAGGSDTQVQYNNSGVLAGSANLTFNGTTLSSGGFSTVGLSTLVKTVKIGDSSFNGVAVFAAATPAKLYMGTGTVTDVTSAIRATNTTGAIASLGITPIAATNTGVTYTNASTLYIAGAPSAGTNITITNPYALYVAAGATNLGGNTAITGTLSATQTLTLSKVSGAADQLVISDTSNGAGLTIGADTNLYRTAANKLATDDDLRFGNDKGIEFNGTANYIRGSSATGVVSVVATTGLAVTGTLSATGTLSGGTSGTGYSFSGSAPATSLTLDSSGNFLVGKTVINNTVVGNELRPDGQTYATRAATTDAEQTLHVFSSGAGAYRFYVGMGGTVFATSIVITAISDQRLKENVRDIDTGLGAIMALKPRRFDWKEGKGQDKKNVAGFIAQEFEDVFPECVGTSKAGEDGIEYKNINHETLIPTLVKAIQEQQALIAALTARLSAAGIA
jgi:hypothetical protein